MSQHTKNLVTAAERIDMPSHRRLELIWLAWIHFSSRSGVNVAHLILD